MIDGISSIVQIIFQILKVKFGMWKLILLLILVGPESSEKSGIYFEIYSWIIILIQPLEHKHGVRKSPKGQLG